MRKNIKALLIATTTLFFLVAFLFISIRHTSNTKKRVRETAIRDCNRALEATAPITPTTELNDKNDVQLLHAQANGLQNVYASNMEFEEDTTELIKDKKLVHIKNNPLYRLKELKHSYPYLTPEAADLLNEISYRFKENLPEKKKNDFLFLITSGLRTNETQFELSKRNRNASPTSAHLFGTTVDISYKEFYNISKDSVISDFDAVQALTKTMQQLRQECRLMVVRERKQACFHFTVVVCRPKQEEE